MYRSLIFIIIFLLKLNSTQATFDTLNLTPIDVTHQITVNHLGNEWMIILDDNSLWEALPLKKRQQTWYEWLFNITPLEWDLEEGFFFDPQTWENAEIQIYKVKTAIFDRYNYLFHNINSDEYVFTKFIPFGTKMLPKLFFVNKFLEFPLNGPTRLQNKPQLKNVIVLEDQSIWKTFNCWGYNIKQDPPDAPFISSLSSWNINDVLQVYFYTETEENSNDLKYGIKQKDRILYLIENQSTNQFVYVSPLTLIEFIKLYDDLLKHKYQQGYKDGYKNGYDDGYDDGYDE